MNRIEKNKANTIDQKEKIIKTAIKVFSEKGYNKAKVEDVSTILGVSKSLVYYYFKTKEELYMETLYFIEDQVEDFAVTEISKDIDAFEKLRLITEKIFKFFAGNHGMFIVFTYHDQVKKLSSKHKKKIKSNFFQRIKMLTNIFEEARQEKLIDPHSDSEALALLLFSQISGCLSFYLLGNKQLNPHKLFGIIDRYFFKNLKYTAGKK